ncbi:hypothetical protein [Mucilaginibacter sp. CSA2-8R]|uniref:hypothetical protein n=1 Tax=Mucilaginibacter sp. CSA2-8R TaxID=3141542 RepID=UPI00315C6550
MLDTAIYDGLYAWATHLFKQRPTQECPAEHLLLQVYHQFSKQQKGIKTLTRAKALSAAF